MRSISLFPVLSLASVVSASVPADQLFDFDTRYGPADIRIHRIYDFVFGDGGEMVFASPSSVPNGSQLDRIFRVPEPGMDPEFILFSDTTVSGQPQYITFFHGMTDGGHVVAQNERVMMSGPGVTPPFTTVFDMNSPVSGIAGPLDSADWDGLDYAFQRDEIAFALHGFEYNPYFEHVIHFTDGAAEAVLSTEVTYQFDDGPLTPTSVGEFVGLTNTGIVVADLREPGNFPEENRKMVAVLEENRVEDLFDFGDDLAGTVPGTTLDFPSSYEFHVSDAPSLVFGSQLTGPGIDSTNNYGVIHYANGDDVATVIAQNGSPVRDGGDPIESIQGDIYMAPVTGEVYFRYYLAGNADSLFQQRRGLAFGDPHDLRTIETFSPIPGLDPIPTEIREVTVSPDGLMLVYVDAYDDPINQVGFHGVLLGVNAAGALHVVAVSGETAPGLEGDAYEARWDYYSFPFGYENRMDSCGRVIFEAAWRYYDGGGSHLGNDDGMVMLRLFHPDSDCNGLLDLADIVGFVSAFSSLDSAADTNADGLFDLTDIVGFVTAFNGN